MHEFTPWRVADGRCVLADDAAWVRRLKKSQPGHAWDRETEHCMRCDVDADGAGRPCKAKSRPQVLLGCDVFAEWTGGEDGDGAMSCPKTGEELSINAAGHIWPMGWPSMSDGDDWGATTYTIGHARERFWHLVDDCHWIDFVMPCDLSRVRAGWPDTPRPPQALVDATEDGCDGRSLAKNRPNVILSPPVIRTQADADRELPELLKLADLARLGAVLAPMEEITLPFTLLAKYAELRDGTECRHISLVVVDGGADPMHPDVVRSLRDQCAAAGVPFAFASWGEWGPLDYSPPDCEYGTFIGRTSVLRPDAKVGEWCPRLLARDGEIMYRVGRNQSGRTLDGRTHE